MAQGPMDHDRISSVEKALDEHKELTREQFREILRRIDAEQARREDDAAEQRVALADERKRSDALFAEDRRRHDDLVARNNQRFDRMSILILTTWLSTLATELYLHLRQ